MQHSSILSCVSISCPEVLDYQNLWFLLKDDKPEQIKHELIQYSVRTINNSQVSRKTYPRKMHALYEKTSLYESDSAIFGADWPAPR